MYWTVCQPGPPACVCVGTCSFSWLAGGFAASVLVNNSPSMAAGRTGRGGAIFLAQHIFSEYIIPLQWLQAELVGGLQ